MEDGENASALSRIEQTFFACQPFRECLRGILGTFDFVTLLLTSWTMYASFRRRGPVLAVGRLQLSDVFVTEFLCNRRTHERELAAFVRSALQTNEAHGLVFNLRDRTQNAINQPFATVNVQPWLSASVKLYESIHHACHEERKRSSAGIENERHQSGRIEALVSWLCSALCELKVISANDRRTAFSNYRLNKFVFWRRIAEHHSQHKDWMRERKIDTVTLYERYMESLGIDCTPHEVLKLR